MHAKATGSLGGTATSAPVVLVVNANAAPTTIILNATVSDSDGSIGKVEFFNGATLLAAVTRGLTDSSGMALRRTAIS